MVPDPDLRPWVGLTLIPGVGPQGMRQLLSVFGDPQRVLDAAESALRKVVAPPVARAVVEGPEDSAVDAALAWTADSQNHIVTLADADYPNALLEIPDPPCLLYVKGRRELLNRPAIALVGSRNATPQGAANAEEFAASLSHAGFTVVSGLALGIDAAAHRGGLKGKGSSIAVVGTGLDVVYPARNRPLAHELAASGALVSEFPLGTRPLAGNFPRRNRLISGLALGCLVVEAAQESGSLITARFALEQGREVFAVPGSIHSPLSKGCHALIKQGAKLAESAQDILEELCAIPSAESTAAPAPERDAGAGAILEVMGFDPVDLDTLSLRSGLAPEALAPHLLQLELEGAVAALPGGRFQRLR
ncbi:MAG: DNA-protecting protein DprA [Betaproteobacteria bacterium]|nr:DNA-protecting protein DprA [Betaproteobacteria bacterium]